MDKAPKKKRGIVAPRTSSLPPSRVAAGGEDAHTAAVSLSLSTLFPGEMTQSPPVGQVMVDPRRASAVPRSSSREALKESSSKNISATPPDMTLTAPFVPPKDSAPSTSGANPLVKQVARLQTELSVKNRVIQSLTVKEAILKGKAPASSEDSAVPDSERARLFALLERFRSDLDQAKESCEQNAFNAMQIEKQRKLAEEEVTYLRNAMASLGTDLRSLPFQKNVILNAERERILELETKVRLIETENSSLAEQVQYWTRTSKRNQEARLTAEAVKQALEEEKEASSSSASRNGTLTRGSPVIHGTSEELKNTKDKLAATEVLLQKAQKKMLTFEGTLEEAYNAVEAMEKENEDLQKQLRTKEAVVEELREQVTLLLEDGVGISQSDSSPAFGNVIPKSAEDHELLKRYEELTAEYETILASNVNLKKTVETVTKDKARLEESLRKSRTDLQYATLSKDTLARTLEENEISELGNMRSSNSLSRSTKTSDKTSDLETLRQAYEALEWELVELRAQSIQSGTIHKQLNSSTTEVERLQAALDEATNTVDALRQQVYLLDAQLHDMNAGKSELELVKVVKEKSKQIEGLEKRLLETQDALQDLQSTGSKSEELEAELRDAREEFAKLQIELETARVEVSEFGGLRGQVEELHNIISSLEGEANDLRNKLKVAHVEASEVEGLRGQIETLLSEIAKLEVENKRAATSVANIDRDASELVSLRDQVQELHESLSSLETENSELQRTNKEAEYRIEGLEIAAHKTDDELGNRLQDLADDLMAKGDEIADKNELIASLQEEIEKLRSEHQLGNQPRNVDTSIENALENAQQEIARLESQLQTATAELEELADAHEELEAKLAAKDVQLSRFDDAAGGSEELDAAKAKIAALEAELESVQNEIERISDQQLRLEVEVENKEREISLLKRQSAQTQQSSEEVTSLNIRVAKLEEELALTSQELDELTSEHFKLDAEHQKKILELEALQKEHASPKANVDVSRDAELEDQVASLTRDLEELVRSEQKVRMSEKELQDRVIEERHHVSELEVSLKQIQAERDSELIRLKSQDDDLSALKLRNQNLEQQIDRLELASEIVEELQKKHKLASDTLQESEDMVMNQRIKIQDLEAKVADLESELELSKGTQNALERDLKDLESKYTEVAQTRNAAAEAEATQNDLIAQLESSKTTINLLKSQLSDQMRETEEVMIAAQIKSESLRDQPDVTLRIQELESALTKKSGELHSLEGEHSELARLFSVLKDELDVKDVSCSKLKDELESMAPSLAEQKALVATLQEEISKNVILDKSHITSIESQLLESQSMIKDLQEEISRLEGRLQISEGVKTDLDRFLALEADLELVADQVEKREQELTDVKSLFEQEKKETLLLAQKLQLAEESLVAARSGPSDKVARLQEELSAKELDLQNYKNAVSELQGQFDSVTEVFKESEARSDKITAESVRTVAKLEEQLQKAHESLKKGLLSETLLIDSQRKMSELESEKELLEVQLQKLNERLIQADSNRRLTLTPNGDQSAGLASVIEASQKQAEQAEKAIDALQSEMNVAYEKISQLTVDRVERQREIEDLEDENQMLKQQISDLMKQIKDLKDNFKSLFPGTL